MVRLEGKAAIVTGGARGIGAACAAALCTDGAAVLITDLLVERGAAEAARLRALGHSADFIAHDVRDAAQWKAAVDRALERFGRVDVLVNNAGVTDAQTIETATLESFKALLDINLFGPFLGMQAVAPAMRRQGGGSIVNISSNATKKMVALTTTYGPAKSALATLTKTAAIHFAETRAGIRVNSVHPGPTETDMLLGGAEKAAEIPAVKQLIDRIPMGRMGRPAEIASVVAFLASDDSSYMTAAELFVDGGVSVV